MSKSKLIATAGIAITGVMASLIIHNKSQVEFRKREDLLRQQDEQLIGLSAEHQRLSNLVASASAAPSDPRLAELEKLRGESEVLKKQRHALTAQSAKTTALPLSQPPAAKEDHPEEFWDQLHQLAGQKPMEARDLGTALRSYASDHQGQFPSNLDAIASYLADEKRSLSGSNHFEIVYHGTLDKLEGIPLGNVAVVRDQQTWVGPDGKPRRVYGMADGVGQIVESDDNFQSWEAEHIVSPPASSQSAK
ncbi:MAG: hypothetical protein JWR69_2869 [Pedosphaera sp.]|nr:hypothetical protein [Pedosphaera sp.]